MFETEGVDKIETHVIFSIKVFFSEKHAVCGIMWKNLAQPDRPQMKIGRMPIASRIPKDTNTHSEYVILIAFPLQQRLRDRASMLRHSPLPV
jgi:hypothetical protein